MNVLSELKKLKSLNITIKDPEPDIKFLLGMKNLEKLALFGEPKLIPSINHHDEPEYITDQILDLAIIGTLTKLDSLTLEGFVLKNISSLDNLNNINTVWVDGSILMDNTEKTNKELSWDSTYGK